MNRPDRASFIAARMPEWIALLARLVRIPSPFESEHAMVDVVEAHLRALGCPTVRRVAHDASRLARLAGAQPPISEVPDRASLIAVVPSERGGPSFTLNAHLDIAAEGPHETWTHAPFGGDVDAAEQRLYGRGAYDDKAGVVCCLAVAEMALAGQISLQGDLVFHLVLEDEITGNGTLLCLSDGPRTDAALIVDGTRLDRAIREHAGQARCRVAVTGKPVSVAVTHLGVNAAECASALALQVKAAVHHLNDSRSETWRVLPSPFQASLQQLAAAAPIFTVPERATAEFHFTFCPPYTLATFQQFVEDRIRAVSAENNWPPPQVEWVGFNCEPVAAKVAALEARLAAAVAATGGPPVVIGPSTGTSDLRHYVAAGVPCLLHGPGNGQNPHRPDEYFDLRDLPTMIARLAALLEIN
jgi:acetylornithine deacetylase